MKEFQIGTKILCGPGTAQRLKDVNAKKLLVVTDPYFAENGTAQKIAAAAGAQQVQLFDRVAPDPTVELVAEGTAIVKEFAPDVIVALGGGSAMDCAKAMLYFAGGNIRLVAIPTTSGSGSEVTDFAILTHENVKHPLIDSYLRPEIAILDDDLVAGLPKSLVADGGFDALSHALEALAAQNANPFTDALAKDAFCCAFSSLPASFAGDRQARGSVHIAATMAGMAFTQAGLGICHALSHSLGGMFHLPHGRLNAILLPAVVSCNASAAGEKYAKLARAAGLGGSVETIAVRNLKNALIRLRRELRLPETLAQAGVDPREIGYRMGDIIQAALKDPCCRTNPVKPDAAMLRKLLEEVTGRG